MKNAEYKGVTQYKGRTSHIFEIELCGKRAFIVANEYDGMGVQLYSISDSSEILIGIKKPK